MHIRNWTEDLMDVTVIWNISIQATYSCLYRMYESIQLFVTQIL